MSQHTYPDQLEIQPFVGRLSATVSVPGSKSITNRALVLAALSCDDSEITISNVLQSEDTEVMLSALGELGFDIFGEPIVGAVRIMKEYGRPKTGRIIPATTAELFVANSGTTMRFLTAMLGLGDGRYRIDGVSRMRERPIQDLLDAMQALGVNARAESANGCPPVVIESNGMKGGRVRIRGEISSQFLSGLLLAAPFGSGQVTIDVDGPLVSIPYVEMTIAMMRQWGMPVYVESGRSFRVQPRQKTAPIHGYSVEPDASAASYFWASAAILGGRVTVSGLTANSLQGDVHFVDVLEQMGCRVETCDAGITVHGGPLRGIDVDMNAISDTVMTLGAVACFAEGPTRIRNVGHIRHKETDRISALANELRRLGVEFEEFEDGLKITPRPLQGAAVETYNDHRMAMSLALIGLKVPGVVIKNPGCVAKTYPGFWQDLSKVQSQK